jgi:predicted tellurium resistance membrane protein TerC
MSLGLGAFGLLSFVVFVLVLKHVVHAPLGVWERGSVYSILVWQMFTATWLIARFSRRPNL